LQVNFVFCTKKLFAAELTSNKIVLNKIVFLAKHSTS
jgi:hypothetical protein